MKKFIKVVCFLLIIALISLMLGRYFYYAKSNMRARIYTYSTLEANTVDAVFIGTSGVARFFVPGYSYDKYGLSVYPLTIDGMQCWHALTTLKYALETQSPKVAMFDTRMFTVNDDTSRCEYRSRYLVDSFGIFSKYRIEASYRAVKYLGELDVENPLDITYYFNILRYHDMWQDDLDFENGLKKTTKFLGYNFTKVASHILEIPDSEYTDKSTKLVWFAQECLDELIQFCKDNDIELVFINSPHAEDEATMERINYLYDYLDEKGIPYMDFVTEEGVEQYPMDRTHDFYNGGHVNYYGATKFTSYVSEYLIENYSLKNHSGDDKYYQWRDAAEATYKKAKKIGVMDN